MPKMEKRKRHEPVEDSSTEGDAASEQNGHASSSFAIPPPAECPFKIEIPRLRKNRRRSKVRKVTDGGNGISEISPFSSDLDISYNVRPTEDWEAMKKYRNFVVGEETFGVNDYVFVNHLGIEHGTVLSPSDERKFWIAHVLEIRARDQQHVYLRVFWCYWPDELPEGRRPYHGRDEVVVSNHMEVIDAMTVAGGASVQHWGEKDTDDKLDGLYWRQTFRFDTQNLSSIRKHCSCRGYYNPDHMLVGCSNPECGRWLHESCVIKDGMKRLVTRAQESKGKFEVPPESSLSSVIVSDADKDTPPKIVIKARPHTKDGEMEGFGPTWEEDLLCLVCHKKIT